MAALATVLVLVGLALCAVVIVVRFAWITAQPDEWLLRVRNGKVVDAGVGISIWRRPGDVIARFSSTIQRVRFSVEALSIEHLTVVVDGFILWSVAPMSKGHLGRSASWGSQTSTGHPRHSRARPTC